MNQPGRYLSCAVCVAVVLLLSALEPFSSQWLEFNRNRIDQGQWWRLLTCHWVHLSLLHAMGNIGGLALLAAITRRTVKDSVLAWLLLWCSCITGLGLILLAADLQRYVGLSGVLHGVLMVAPFLASGYSRRVALLFAGLIVVKVLWEQTPFYSDQAIMAIIGGRVETRAHLLGVIAGGIWLLAMAVWSRISRRDSPYVSE